MNNLKLLNLLNLNGGSDNIIKINYLNEMIDNDIDNDNDSDNTESSTSDYTVSYLDGLDSTDIEGGKGKGFKLLKDIKNIKNKKLLKNVDDIFKQALDSESTDSGLENQVRHHLSNRHKSKKHKSKKHKSKKHKSKPLPTINSEEELKNIIETYVPGKQTQPNILKLVDISKQYKQPIMQVAEPSTEQNISIGSPVNYGLLNQAYTIVPMLVPTSALNKEQLGGEVNKKLEKVNKEIEALENKLY